jgi:hypothetical protein
VVQGGILGAIKWGWLHREGITHYHLETTRFQALPFYQKQGYAVFGQLPDRPPGHISYFQNKTEQ